MSQINQPNQPTQPRNNGRTLAIAGLTLVVILSLAFAGYTALNPHSTTFTQQQFVTETQSLSTTQTQTMITTSMVTSVQSVTTTAGYGNVYAQSCPYGCYYPPPPNYNYTAPYNYNGYNPPCQSTDNTGTVRCSGYFFQASNGCAVLVIPIWNPYIQESYVYQYYTLHNLPTTYSNLTWVTVTGQLYHGYNTSGSGAACPGNYINVTSISQ
jgi:hypothetical protein